MDDTDIDDLLEGCISVSSEAPTVVKKPAPTKPATVVKPTATATKPAATKPAAMKPAATVAKPAATVAKPTLKILQTPDDEYTGPEDVRDPEEFVMSDFKEHVQKKGMWAGALKPVAIPDLLGAVLDEGKVELVAIERPHTPAVLKSIDEILVNATDHWKTHEKSPPSQRVTRITVEFDHATGRVTVENDGPGIPVTVHAKATEMDGHTVYVPEVAFAKFLAGTNINKAKDCVRGGINGLGAKIANVHSTEFEFETVDAATKLYYSQRFRNRMGERGEPVVVDLRKKHTLPLGATKPHTRVSFVMAFGALGYGGARRGKTAPDASGPLAAADADDIAAWLCLRAHQAAAYAGPKVAVTYNGARCETTSAAALAGLLASAYEEGASAGASAVVLSGQARAAEEPCKSHPWDVAVVVLPPGRKTGRRAAAQNMTIVNGVLSNKGTHVKHLKAALGGAIDDKVRRATKTGKAKDGEKEQVAQKDISACIRLVMVGAIPGADWGGQRKDELQVPQKKIEQWTLPAAFLKRVADAVAERLLLERDGGTKKKFDHEGKYVEAEYAGKTRRADTLLLAGEGDSALSMIKAGITQKRKSVPPGGPTIDWCGRISLQGVVVNAARQVTEVKTTDGKTITVRSEKLKNNVRLQALEDAFGLRHGVPYTTAEELATLNYGKLVLCVDQDLDGTGKIAPLVLVWVWQFWPALFSAGRVGRFVTPLVRVYPKSGKKGAELKEFYYEEHLAQWLAENPDWAEQYHPPKYYKGLAGHSDDEVKRMFEPAAFQSAVHIYALDEVTKELFNVYFGPDASLRKKALLEPVLHLAPEVAASLQRCRQIPLGRVQLDIDTKAYKNDAIKRQIPGAADGLNPARRKILMGALQRFANEAASKEIRVFQLGGAVADKLFYHHGDASLNATIVYMAQAFRGARRYPFLTGVGRFGTMHGAEGEIGSARYISVMLSPLIKVAFPPADRWHLEYIFEDGSRAEPRTLVPVVPLAVLESNHNVSEGWNHGSYSRRTEEVLRVVRAYIAGDAELVAAARRLHEEGSTAAAMEEVRKLEKKWPLPPETGGYAGEVRPYKGEPHSFGVYEWDAVRDVVTVTDLPIGVTTAAYLKTLTAPVRGKPNPRAAYIEKVNDRSPEDGIEIQVKLRKGSFVEIQSAYGDLTIDPLEDFLQLRASLRPHLNYYSARGGVLEFGESYLAPILYWAHMRAALYVARATRERIVADLHVRVETETLRYIAMAAALDLASIEDEEVASAKLTEHGFPTFDTGLLHEPGYTPNEALHGLVAGGPRASHNYILGLQERELLKKAVAARHKKLEAYKGDLRAAMARLEEKPTPAASVWAVEIGHFLTLAKPKPK